MSITIVYYFIKLLYYFINLLASSHIGGCLDHFFLSFFFLETLNKISVSSYYYNGLYW